MNQKIISKMMISLDKYACVECFNDCEGEHESNIMICDDCLSDKLAREEVEE